MLLDSLEKRIDSLIDSLDKDALEIDESFIEDLNSFASEALENVDVLADEKVTDNKLDSFIEKVYKDKDVDIEEYKDELKAYKKLTEGKLNPDADDTLRSLFELSEEQIDFIKKVCQDSKDYIEKAKEKLNKNKEIQDSVESYQNLSSKMNSDEKLNEQDFEKVTELAETESDKDKIDMYKDFLFHNLDVKEDDNITEKHEIEIDEVEENDDKIIEEKEIDNEFNKEKENVDESNEVTEEEINQIIEDLKNTSKEIKNNDKEIEEDDIEI